MSTTTAGDKVRAVYNQHLDALLAEIDAGKTDEPMSNVDAYATILRTISTVGSGLRDAIAALADMQSDPPPT